MKKINLGAAISVVLIFLFLLPTVVLAGGYNLAGVGAKALAMACAFRGVSDDWSSMYWNPAGLAGQSNSVYIDVKSLSPIVWLTPNVASTYGDYTGYRNGVEQTSSAKNYLAGSFGLVYSLNDKYTLGLSVFAPSALGAEWNNLFTGPPHGYNNDVAYPERGWFSDLKVIDIHPTVGYMASDRLSFGVGIAIQYADLMLESPKLMPSGAPMPYQHFYVDAILEGTGIGFGFNVGMLFKATDDMRVGLSYRGPVTVPVEGKVKQLLILPNNPAIIALDPTKAPLFSGGSLSADPDATTDFPVPMDFGFGVAYDVNDKLTLATDILWTNWEDVDIIKIDVDGNGPTGEPSDDTELILMYENSFRYSFGFNYQLKPGLDLRGGYYYEETPIPDGSLRPTIADVNDKSNISVGFGWDFRDNMILEGYYERVFTAEREIGDEDIDGDGSIDNLAGKWKMQVDTFGLTFGYRF